MRSTIRWILLFVFTCIYSFSSLCSSDQTYEHRKAPVDSLLKWAQGTWQYDIDSAIILTKIAHRRSLQSSDQNQIARTHLKLGSYFQYKGTVPEAYQHLRSAADLFRILDLRKLEAKSLHNIGLLYSTAGNLIKAREYFMKALRIKEEVDDIKSISTTLIKLADVYRSEGNYRRSESILLRAHDICSQNDFIVCQSVTSSNLAGLYKAMDSLKRALKWYDKALAIIRETGSPHAEAMLLMDMSRIYLDRKSFLKAEEQIQSAIDIARKSQSELLLGNGFKSMAALYEAQNRWQRASEYHAKAMSIYRRSNFRSDYLQSGLNYARILLKINKLDSTFALSDQLAQFARRNGNRKMQERALKSALKVLQIRGDSSGMAEIQARLMVVRDSLYKLEKHQRIQSLETQHALYEKEQELETLKEQERRQQLWQNRLIGGILFLLIIGGLLINRHRLKMRKKEVELELSAWKHQELQSDLEHKNKQLTRHALHMAQKNQILKGVREGLENLKKDIPSSKRDQWRSLMHEIDYSFSLDEDWKEFKLYFEEVHEYFFNALEWISSGDLRPNDYRIAALARLNLSIKQMASLLNISPDSVKVARYRLRKKLPLETEEHLGEFLSQIEKNYKNSEHT